MVKMKKKIEKLIIEIKKKDIRKRRGSTIAILYTAFCVYVCSEQLKIFKENLQKITKINCENLEEEISGNLTLWQSEKEAKKLFPENKTNK